MSFHFPNTENKGSSERWLLHQNKQSIVACWGSILLKESEENVNGKMAFRRAASMAGLLISPYFPSSRPTRDTSTYFLLKYHFRIFVRAFYKLG
jgi:hypothetical protein